MKTPTLTNRLPNHLLAVGIGALLALSTLVSASAVQAQTGLSVQQFNLMPSQTTGYFNVGTARVLEHLQWETGLYLNYADDPLVLSDSEGNRVLSVVKNQLTMDLMGAIGFVDHLSLGVGVPLVLMQNGDEFSQMPDADASSASFGLGDIRLIPQAMFFSTETEDKSVGVSLGLLASLWLPTGNDENYQSEGFRAEPRLLFDVGFGNGHRIGANAGYMVRKETNIGNLDVNDSFTYGLAGDIRLAEIWRAILEVEGEVAVQASDVGPEEMPVEVIAGIKARPWQDILLSFGASMGVNEGFGMPDWRVFAGVSYSRVPVWDSDDDGILDDDDACPEQPEDIDLFADADGCPEFDNDLDTLEDIVDDCPLEPEDFDTYADADGCPDPDNDGDQILDVDDLCALDPEDIDGWHDDDGCPEPDNDFDGIPDVGDLCPFDPEVFNGLEDDDGCPDELTLVEASCDRIDLRESVYFDTNSDSIQDRSFEMLDQVVGIMTARDDIHLVRIEGHTDDRGRDDRNLDLSQRRAQAVMEFLGRRGIGMERLEAVGYGEDFPIADNDTREGRATNRRVEFIIVDQSTEGCAE